MYSSRRCSRKLIYCRSREETFKSVSLSFPRPMLENPDSGNFCFWNYSPESGTKNCGIRNTTQGVRNPTNDWEIQNSSSIDKDWNPVPRFQNTRRGIQNPGRSWIPLHRTNGISAIQVWPLNLLSKK